MANLLERTMDNLAMRIVGYMQTNREQVFDTIKDYYAGNHPNQLKVKPGQDNDNVAINFIGLSINRAVSMLIGDGVEFKLPEGADAQQEYINQVWDINKRQILIHEIALDGSLMGTLFVKIIDGGLQNPYSGELFPRLVLLDPSLMTIECDPMDKSRVNKYIMQFKIKQGGREVLYKEVTRRATPDDYATPVEETSNWIVESWQNTGTWILINSVEFPFDFPPIHHWKKLPSIHSVYGSSDVEQVFNAQDKYNFVHGFITITAKGKTYKVYSTHNIGKSECKLKNMARSHPDCDLVIGAHVHTPKVVAVAQQLHSGKTKTTYAVTGKAWLQDESYSISAAYEPVSDIQPVIMLGDEIRIVQ